MVITENESLIAHDATAESAPKQDSAELSLLSHAEAILRGFAGSIPSANELATNVRGHVSPQIIEYIDKAAEVVTSTATQVAAHPAAVRVAAAVQAGSTYATDKATDVVGVATSKASAVADSARVSAAAAAEVAAAQGAVLRHFADDAVAGAYSAVLAGHHLAASAGNKTVVQVRSGMLRAALLGAPVLSQISEKVCGPEVAAAASQAVVATHSAESVARARAERYGIPLTTEQLQERVDKVLKLLEPHFEAIAALPAVEGTRTRVQPILAAAYTRLSGAAAAVYGITEPAVRNANTRLAPAYTYINEVALAPAYTYASEFIATVSEPLVTAINEGSSRGKLLTEESVGRVELLSEEAAERAALAAAAAADAAQLAN